VTDKELGGVLDPREPETTPDISVNDYGRTKDPAVVVDEGARTVLLTPDQTIIMEKEPAIDIVPKNRPRSVYAGMWGRNEIASVAIGVMTLLAVAIIYFFLVVPSNNELARHRSEVETLTVEQQNADKNFGTSKDTETKVADVISSEQNFEAAYLPTEATGRTALYQRLNGLIDAYGLINTSGPDYSALATIDQEKASQSDEEKGRERFRSIFPGMYVTMTVEGSYQNLRRFIRELEAGKEFVIISAVQLEPSENQQSRSNNSTGQVQQQQQPQMQMPNGLTGRIQNGPPVSQGPVYVAPKGKTHGEVVSLHLEMAAYFRRPNFDQAAAQ
jgi:hypothetical protein